ncbi:hypothetical protein C4564_03335 [Candidatus Microgenomates bacterium]|nr:MAG: hypothetical protein C4564_03335 [Candidatus Microgenomates bacterium]
MSEAELTTPEFRLTDIEELRGEQNYFNKIKRIEGEDKLWKQLQSFPSSQAAQEYISRTPSKRGDKLSAFLPATRYIIKQGVDKVSVIAVAKEIHGNRLDKVGSDLSTDALSQLDTFVSESLIIYEQEGICPGINLKNFILADDQKLYYIDSEPCPPYNLEPFEVAHAREQRLLRTFGEDAKNKFPDTWDWIENHRVENYKKAQSEAKKRRRAA